MDTDHEASSAWTDLARWQKKDPEIGPIVRLQTEYERLNGYETVETSRKWGTYAMDCCIAGSSLIAVTLSTYSVISAPEVCKDCAL